MSINDHYFMHHNICRTLLTLTFPPTLPLLFNEHQQPLYMCFVDFTRAFDNISHEQLWVTEMGYPVHIIILLTKLYGKQQARVRVAGGLSNKFRVKKGVRQGVCNITLFVQHNGGGG